MTLSVEGVLAGAGLLSPEAKGFLVAGAVLQDA